MPSLEQLPSAAMQVLVLLLKNPCFRAACCTRRAQVMTPEHRARIICEEFALGKWEPGVTLENKIAEAIHAAIYDASVKDETQGRSNA